MDLYLGTYGKKTFMADSRINSFGILEMEMYFIYSDYALTWPISKKYPQAESRLRTYYNKNIAESIDFVLHTLEEYDVAELTEIYKKACFYTEYKGKCVTVPDSEILKD